MPLRGSCTFSNLLEHDTSVPMFCKIIQSFGFFKSENYTMGGIFWGYFHRSMIWVFLTAASSLICPQPPLVVIMEKKRKSQYLGSCTTLYSLFTFLGVSAIM